MSEWVKLNVEVDVSSYQSILVRRDSESYKKYLHWRETGEDSDFEDLVDWIREEVADDMEFRIEDVEE